MNADDLHNHLQVMSGGSLVLTTEQLSRCLSMNPKVISRMRQERRFPIPHKTIGAKIVYPIVTVAKYLVSEDPEPNLEHPVAKTQGIAPKTRRAVSKKAVMPDLSRKMLLRGFLSALEQQKESMGRLVLFLERKIPHDDMQVALPKHPEVKQVCPIVKI